MLFRGLEKSTVLSSCEYHTEQCDVHSGLAFHFGEPVNIEKLTFMDLEHAQYTTHTMVIAKR